MRLSFVVIGLLFFITSCKSECDTCPYEKLSDTDSTWIHSSERINGEFSLEPSVEAEISRKVADLQLGIEGDIKANLMKFDSVSSISTFDESYKSIVREYAFMRLFFCPLYKTACETGIPKEKNRITREFMTRFDKFRKEVRNEKLKDKKVSQTELKTKEDSLTRQQNYNQSNNSQDKNTKAILLKATPYWWGNTEYIEVNNQKRSMSKEYVGHILIPLNDEFEDTINVKLIAASKEEEVFTIPNTNEDTLKFNPFN
ncbi:hypothetical protein WAF17_16485 [Bernardetia sp. ABR2-2B]|uniref:hypothetical protein n=1 Tax=Bernardetia sp. ABR2-2B TaxID=3127472 RepID=UPI0030CB7185